MVQAAADTRIPMAILKRAKMNGCPAFRSNRVYLRVFLHWYFNKTMEDGGRDWSRELKKAQALREQIRLEEDAGRVVDRDVVEESLRGCLVEFFGAMDRTFCSEMPPILKGLDEVSLRSKIRGEINQLKKRLKRRFATLAGK